MLEVDPEIPDVDDPEEIPEEDVPLVPSDTKPGEEIPDENVPLGNPATGPPPSQRWLLRPLF